MIEHHSIPALRELQARPQWVCWRKEQRKDKWTKVPYDPRTGQMARSNDLVQL
jgi:putative DNA primase/helicase